ncbi:mitochondrial pyruvate carrier-like protein [Culicoides brevitarsis]|uniref:mitochondrial pyruvate carrier-like protein n=1 Tax=Culicoides brevitarsis TaxID=469753 RepID=UPI00307BE6BE
MEESPEHKVESGKDQENPSSSSEGGEADKPAPKTAEKSIFDSCVPKSWLEEGSFWNHPAGPKTIFFWAPAFKWGLVLAGLKDLARAAASLSIAQTIALFFTGCIWSRYSLVIIPKNWSLFAVNAFVALTQMVQLGRAIHYHYFTDHPDGDLILPTNSSISLADIITSDGGSGYGPLMGNLTAGAIEHDGVI